MKNFDLNNCHFEYTTEKSRVYAQPGENYVATRGSIVFACEGSQVIANQFSCVIAQKGSIVVASDYSVILAEEGCQIFRRKRSIICNRKIDRVEDKILWATKSGQTFGDREIIIAYPDTEFKTGTSCLVFAPSRVRCKVGDFSKVYAGELTYVLVGHDCNVTALNKTCIVERDPIIKSLPKYTVLEE